PLASTIAKSLYVYIEHRKKFTDNDQKIIDSHVDALSGIFANKITDDGGVVGSELLKTLAVLISKYGD
ncbi:MAG: hypothetical protein KDB97_12445, partial [Flavobacteriales bacterium]|nr:hypothetical protein [Flavobacteriales bacterium]